MKAYEMKGRKVLFRWKGKDDVLKCFVNDFEIEDGEAVFSFTSITGKSFKAKNGEFDWQDNEEEVEREARSAYANYHATVEMYGSLNDEDYAKVKDILGADMIKTSKDIFEDKKKALVDYRLEKTKVSRQYYNAGELHVFYDIKNGNNVDRFMTLEEIEEMKVQFAKPDYLRGSTELHHLQAFNEEGELVIDEWNM